MLDIRMLDIRAKLAEQKVEQEKALQRLLERQEKERFAVENTGQFLQEAESMGLKLKIPYSLWGLEAPIFEVANLSDFRIIHKLVGTLKDAGMYTCDEATPRNPWVWKCLVPTAPQWGHIQFRYKKRLKVKKGAKCRVIRKRSPASSYTTVVCE